MIFSLLRLSLPYHSGDIYAHIFLTSQILLVYAEAYYFVGIKGPGSLEASWPAMSWEFFHYLLRISHSALSYRYCCPTESVATPVRVRAYSYSPKEV